MHISNFFSQSLNEAIGRAALSETVYYFFFQDKKTLVICRSALKDLSKDKNCNLMAVKVIAF